MQVSDGKSFMFLDLVVVVMCVGGGREGFPGDVQTS